MKTSTRDENNKHCKKNAIKKCSIKRFTHQKSKMKDEIKQKKKRREMTKKRKKKRMQRSHDYSSFIL